MKIKSEAFGRPDENGNGNENGNKTLGRGNLGQENGLHGNADINNMKQLLSEVLGPAAKLSLNDNSPGYMAYIPSGGLFHASVASFIGSALNRYVTINDAAPGFAAIERECVEWMCKDVIGWTGNNNDNNKSSSSKSGGILCSGGAMANLQALHAARTYAFSLPLTTATDIDSSDYQNQNTINQFHGGDLRLGTVYVSEQAHYCIEK